MEEHFSRRIAAVEEENKRLREELVRSQKVERELRDQLRSIEQEVTGCEQAKADLWRERELWQKIFEHIPIMVTIYRPDLQMLQFNPAFERITGWTNEDANQGDFMEKVYPDPTYRQMVTEFMRSLEDGWRDFTVTAKDGASIESSWSNILLSDDTQIGIGIDLRERKHAEQELISSWAKLETTLASMTDAVFASDVEGNFLEFNEAFATFHRFANKEECAKTLIEYPEFLEVYFPDGTLAPLDMWAVPRALRGETATNVIYILRRKDTGESWVGSYSFAPIRDAGGEIIGSVVVGRDVTEQRQAEQALRESEAKMRAVFQALVEGVVFLNSQGEVEEVNDAIERSFGHTLEELVDPQLDPRSRIIRPDGSLFPISEQPGMVALRTGQAVRNVEMGVPTPDGEINWRLVNAQPVYNDQGDLLGAAVSLFDITERRQYEKALRKSEERFSKAFKVSPDAMIISHLENGEIIEVNESFERMFGYSREEALGKTTLELNIYVDPKDRVEMVERVQKQGAIHNFEINVRSRSDEVHYTTISAETMEANGEQQLVTMLHDLTDRKRYEEALQESESRFRIALQNTPISVYTTDLDLRYTWMHECKDKSGLGNMMGKRDDELYPPEDVRELIAFKQSVLNLGVAARKEIHFPVNGQERVFDINAEPLRNTDGEITGLTVVAVDVTELLNLKAEVVRREERIEIQRRISQEQEKERARIARDLHDGPLQELISSNFLVAEIQQIDDVTERAEKLDRLANSLEEQAVELRSFCNELRPPALAPFGLEKAIRSHVELVKERHPSLRINTKLEPDLRSIPEDTRMILYRVYQESMNNILKHANATEVSVRFRFNEKQAELEMRDNGRGFVLPESWITLARQGHLGLVGMRERVENVGGQVLIKSAPGAGTAIRVVAPLNNYRI